MATPPRSRSSDHQPINFSAHKLRLPSDANLQQRIWRSREMLCRVLNLGTTVVVVGSGCSASLGYPTWTGLVAGVLNLVRQHLKSRRDSNWRLLRGYQKRLRDGTAEAQHLMFYIGVCKELLRLHEELDVYGNYLYEEFKRLREKVEQEKVAHNPYRILTKRFPVDRFMTTNYDVEIEQALSAERGINFERFGIDEDASAHYLSFTQEPDYIPQLARIAITRPSRDERGAQVFHCHGRYDRRDSTIASEKDYQRWYVGHAEDSGPAFRQTIQLLFESNPLLFIGYSGRDPDLLQPLRQLGALDPARKESRPVFALMDTEDPEVEDPEHEMLYERYGLHVIPFRRPRRHASWGRVYCDELKKLLRQYEGGRTRWLQKPALRTPQIAGVDSKRCYAIRFAKQSIAEFQTAPTLDLMDEILEQIAAGKRIVGLIGAGGSGKSWHAFRLIEEAKKWRPRDREYEGIFYWNAHYSNEAVTALDIALAHLERNQPPVHPMLRLDRLAACLQRPNLLIVDGCERLLRPGDRPDEGFALSRGFRQLLEAFSSSRSQSTVILAGRLWPADLDELGRGTAGRVVFARANPNSFGHRPPFSKLRPAQLSMLSSLLKGHSYGLLLAGKYVMRTGDEKLQVRIQKLQGKLAYRSPKKRVDEMIKLTIDELAKRTENAGSALLELLALFLEPVGRRTVEICYQQACRRPPRSLGGLLRELRQDCLLFGVAGDPPRFVVHASVRKHFIRRDRRQNSAVFPDFVLSGSTGGSLGIHPGSEERVHKVRELFRRLCDSASDVTEDRAALCRDAYGLLRSQMEYTTAPQWGLDERDPEARGAYERYMEFGIRLATVAKEVSPPLWEYCDPHERAAIERAEAPLYAAELSWLYNDVALALFSEGLLPDAYSVWEQAYEINRVLEGPEPRGEFAIESLLNLTHVLIELGKLESATSYLDEAARLNSQLGDSDTAGRIDGFRGLLEHIRGNLSQAAEHYESCLRRLRDGRNRRAGSFFLLMRAGLELEQEELAKAEQSLISSRALAEAGDLADLAGYARLREGELQVARGKLREGRLSYQQALEEASRLGARGLQAFIYLRIADLSLLHGDSQSARWTAMKSVRIANELGQGLLITRALLTLGRATYEAGERILGIEYLRLAEERARAQQYGLRRREAERELQERHEPVHSQAREILSKSHERRHRPSS